MLKRRDEVGIFCTIGNHFVILQRFRGVAQPGLEYASGGRVVASSNLVTPTRKQRSNNQAVITPFYLLGRAFNLKKKPKILTQTDTNCQFLSTY